MLRLIPITIPNADYTSLCLHPIRDLPNHNIRIIPKSRNHFINYQVYKRHKNYLVSCADWCGNNDREYQAPGLVTGDNGMAITESDTRTWQILHPLIFYYTRRKHMSNEGLR